MPSDRFSRQIATGLISREEQKALAKKTVAIVGLGGLGSVSAELILRSGVRNLILIDRDVVEQSNLSRQLYFEEDTGLAKAEALKTKLFKIDSKAKISVHVMDFDATNANVLKKADIILDGTDNMDARFLINEFALKNKIPWVYAAATGSVGATMNVIPEGPCFSCVFGGGTSPEGCGVLGVINSATVASTSFQVVEALKILLGKKDVSRNLMYVDVWSGELKKIKVKRSSSCGVCREK